MAKPKRYSLVAPLISSILFLTFPCHAESRRNVGNGERTSTGVPIELDRRCKSYIGSGYFDKFNIDGSRRRVEEIRASGNEPAGVPLIEHLGIDIVAPQGTPVYAPGNGTVELVGDSVYGKLVVIRQDFDSSGQSDWILTFHYQSTAAKVGDRAKAGETLLGLVGQTGTGVGPHLHLELRKWGVKVLEHQVNRLGKIGPAFSIYDRRGMRRGPANPHDKWFNPSGGSAVKIQIYEPGRDYSDAMLKGQWIWPIRCN